MNIVLEYVQYDSAGASGRKAFLAPEAPETPDTAPAKGALLRSDEIAAVPESNAESGASTIARNSSSNIFHFT